ncbi:hypothetical protein D3C72_2388120 [compost metagenome]
MALAHIFDEFHIIMRTGSHLSFITTDCLDLVQCKVRVLVKDQIGPHAISENAGSQQRQ